MYSHKQQVDKGLYHVPPQHTWWFMCQMVLPGNGENAKRCKREPIASGKSSLLDTLLDLVGRGGAHIETAAEIARAVEADSSSNTIHQIHQGVRQLAACGSHGKHNQNTERDFQRMLRGANGLQLQPYNIKLRLQVSQMNKSFF